jgi:WD40 repeat protein
VARLFAVVLACIGLGMGPADAKAPSAVVTLPASVTSFVVVNGSSTIAVGLSDGRIAVWNGRDATPSFILKPHGTRILAVGSSEDGRSVLSVASDGTLARTSIGAGPSGNVQRVGLGPAPTRSAIFSSDGSRFVAGGEFGDIRVYDAATGALLHELRGHRGELQDLAVRPGSSMLASAGADADLRLWDTASGQQTAVADDDLSLFALAFSPGDGTLASGGADRRVTLRNAKTLAPVSLAELPAPKMVSTLAWSPDGRLVAIGDLDDASLTKGGIQVLDASTRAVIANLDTGGVPANRIAFLTNDRLVATFGADLRAWSVATAR